MWFATFRARPCVERPSQRSVTGNKLGLALGSSVLPV